MYKLLAIDISSYTAKVENKRIAVVPFSYADSTSSIKDGTVISERLSMELIKLKNEVIERNALEKVLKELKLENSGIVDPQKAVELGKILGVDFLITGTLVRAKDNKIEVNARIVEVETARAVKAFQIYVIKDWLGGDVGDKEKSPSENRFLIRRRR
ncbi:MAG: CsgG/HfaB family protein [Elusimicrobiota bacterium]